MKADDLVLLLEVARAGSLVGAASAAGVDHTTISRRMDALERDVGAPLVVRSSQGCRLTDLGRSMLGPSESVERALAQVRDLAESGAKSELSGLVRVAAPDAFASEFVGPAMARMVRAHPRTMVELTAATRPLLKGQGADIEIGLASSLPRWETIELSPYNLGLYASAGYLNDHGVPRAVEELGEHRIVYYVESLLRVAELNVFDELLVDAQVQVTSTSVHAQVTATIGGAGIGLLPCFLADHHTGLRRVLRREVDVENHYIAALAPRSLRRPATTVFLQELRAEVRSRRHELRGSWRPHDQQPREAQERTKPARASHASETSRADADRALPTGSP